MTKRKYLRGPEHQSWKGGRTIDKDGYVDIWMPDHPRSNNMGYVPEHILVAERMLGRSLRLDEIAHHRNGDRSNNNEYNLEVMTQFKHKRLHMLGRKLSEETKRKVSEHHNPKSNLNLHPRKKVAPIV